MKSSSDRIQAFVDAIRHTDVIAACELYESERVVGGLAPAFVVNALAALQEQIYKLQDELDYYK